MSMHDVERHGTGAGTAGLFKAACLVGLLGIVAARGSNSATPVAVVLPRNAQSAR